VPAGAVAQWLRSSSETEKVRDFLGDVCYFFVVTPLMAFGAWMCVAGALEFYRSPFSGPASWKTVLLLGMSIFVLVTYVFYFATFLVRTGSLTSELTTIGFEFDSTAVRLLSGVNVIVT